MRSQPSSTKPDSGAAEPLAANVPAQHVLRPERAVQSLEEFVAFLAEVEAVVGRDERPRPPTIVRWFRL